MNDGNDLKAIEAAIEAAKAETTKPSFIAVRTVIGYGSPKAGTNKVHGEALGAADTAATKKFFGFPEDQSFYVPEEALANWRKAVERGAALEDEWKQLFEKYRAQYPDLAAEFERTKANKRKAGWEKSLPSFPAGKPVATRNAGGAIMNAIAEAVPELFGGAADLTASTKTIFKPGANFHVDPAGRNVFFGVREFAMCAAVNGMAAHEGLVPFGSTFFTFSDYCKPAIRLAALMRAHSLFVFTHDSIALGEDGPTHQPIEHLMMLRAVPDLTDFRPADAQRNRGLLAAGARAHRAVLLCADAAGSARHRSGDARCLRRRQQGRLRSRRRAECQGDSDRHGFRSLALRRCRRSCSKPKAFAARVVSMPELGDLRRAVGRVQGKRAAGGRAKGWPSRQARRWAGGSMWARTAT